MGPPDALILNLKQGLGLEDFVETGTYRGETAAWAAKHFARVTTIELSREFHAAATTRFRTTGNVRPLHGDSATVIGEIVKALPSPALFWLDAHWSGLDTAGREAECPLLAELVAINAARVTHTILVDDARLFCAPPPRPHRAEDWPDLAAVVAALGQEGRRCVILFEDVFVAVPIAAKTWLTEWVQKTAAESSAAAQSPMRWWKKMRA